MAICGIALGGHGGNTQEIFKQALSLLEDDVIRVTAVSSCLRTLPMGADAGDAFVNAAAIIETDLEPTVLLKRLHDIESSFGRTREVHWGPRSLDLDLLFHGSVVVCTDQIVVPHPAMWFRRFVLQPLAEIAPGYCHPVLNESVESLLQRLQQRPLMIAIGGEHLSKDDIAEFERCLNRQFGFGTVRLSSNEQAANSADDYFASIAVDSSVRESSHKQPHHETDRTIRIHPRPDSIAEQTLSALMDVCSAVLG